MRAILINPTERTITEIQVAPGIDAIYAACGWGCFDVVPLTYGEDLYIDDSGLLAYPNPQGYFQLGRAIFAGYALVLGVREGEACDSEIPVALLTRYVRWLDTPPRSAVEPCIEIEVIFTAEAEAEMRLDDSSD